MTLLLNIDQYNHTCGVTYVKYLHTSAPSCCRLKLCYGSVSENRTSPHVFTVKTSNGEAPLGQTRSTVCALLHETQRA